MQYKKCLGGGARAKASTVQRLACTVVTIDPTGCLQNAESGMQRFLGLGLFHHCLICLFVQIMAMHDKTNLCVHRKQKAACVCLSVVNNKSQLE